MRFDLEGSTAVRAGRACIEKGVDLLLKHALLDRGEELLGFSQSQAQMLDALVVLVQGDEVGDGFFTAIIATDDQL